MLCHLELAMRSSHFISISSNHLSYSFNKGISDTGWQSFHFKFLQVIGGGFIVMQSSLLVISFSEPRMHTVITSSFSLVPCQNRKIKLKKRIDLHWTTFNIANASVFQLKLILKIWKAISGMKIIKCRKFTKKEKSFS